MPSSFEKFRNSILRFAHVSKRKLDANFMRRERDDLVQKLGAYLFELIQRGELQEPEQVADLMREIRAIDQQREDRLREAQSIEMGHAEPAKG